MMDVPRNAMTPTASQFERESSEGAVAQLNDCVPGETLFFAPAPLLELGPLQGGHGLGTDGQAGALVYFCTW
jgi:hypothetical protein